MTPRFFRSASAFRAWLAKNHDRITEQWIGFHRKSTGRPGMSYEEAVQEALCFGWIDGIKKSIDETTYTHRFTPRKATSAWSRANLRRIEALIAEGRMMPPGLAVFQARDRRKDAQYLFERGAAAFTAEQEKTFRAKKRAWAFWEAQPPGYRRLVTHWVTSAKREETRASRLAKLIACSAEGKRLPEAGG